MTFGGKGATSRKVRDDETPFHLLLVDDFSGRAARRAQGEVVPLKRPVTVDAAELERAFAALAPALPLAVPGLPAEIFRPSSLDDFHPDHLFARLSMFERPRSLRRELAANRPGEEVFAAVESWLQEVTGRAPGAALPASPSAPPNRPPLRWSACWERRRQRARPRRREMPCGACSRKRSART